MRVYRRLETTVKDSLRGWGLRRGRRRRPRPCRRTQRGLRLLAAALAVVVAGCAADRAAEVTYQELFRLSVGPLEDQVQIGPGYEQAGIRFSLTGGQFHVANAPVRKVMRFSSRGDLLLLLYDPRLNPKPVGLAEAGPDTVSTRLARRRALGVLGRVAADSHGTMYVQERLAPDGWQTEDEVTRSHVVRRFERAGADRGYLGREGVSGTPFGFVHRLVVTARDELFVVTRDTVAWQVYWFDAEGLLRFRRRLEVADFTDGPEAVEIASVIADPRGPPHLLVEAVMQPDGGSDIWRVSGDGPPSRAFAAPRSRSAPFRLIGSADSRLFFVSYAVVDDGSNRAPLTITDLDGRPLAQVELSLQDPALQFSELQVAVDGVLYGARLGPEHVDFFWWRTDLLMQRR